MAIKTKKISELGQIQIDANAVTASDFYLIGCQSGITGKVSTSALVDSIKNIVSNVQGNNARMVAVDERNTAVTDSLKESLDVVVARISKNDSEISHLNESVTSLTEVVNGMTTVSSNCDCAEKIAALEAKVAALEGFVQALQKDGYLTLAEIRKAAATACPICNHTHEEEQSAE